MSLKREADPGFIKPDPDKRVKREGGDGNFSLSSIPWAPTHPATASTTFSDVKPKVESGDRKSLAPASNFGANAGNNRKRKFFGNTIKAMRGNDWVSAHFNKWTMTVHFVMNCPLIKQWSSVEVEKEIFGRLNRAKFDIQPSEHWGFLDRKLREDIRKDVLQPASTVRHYQCEVRVRQMNTYKVENAPDFKKEERISPPKNERFD